MLAMRNFTSDLIAMTEQLPPAAAGLLAPAAPVLMMSPVVADSRRAVCAFAAMIYRAMGEAEIDSASRQGLTHFFTAARQHDLWTESA